MVKQKNVCVIGAGVAGLVAAKTFSARGHRVTILERSGDLGGVWEPARSYPDVQTQSPKDLYRYTDKPMPDSYPEWPKGPQVHAYLTDYAREHGLMQRMRFNTAVVGMARRNSGLPGWTLEIRNPDGSVTHEEYDFVAVCTGQFNERQTISHPGDEAFKAAGGEILHSARAHRSLHRQGKEGRRPRRLEIRNRYRGQLRQRRRERSDAGLSRTGLANSLLHRRADQFQADSLHPRPGGNVPRLGHRQRCPASAHAIAKPFIWANWRGLESLLKLQLKLKKCGMVPEQRIEDGVNCSVPIATPEFFPMVADGRIKAIRGTFDRYDGKTIVMTGGERVAADVAMLAIGFKLGVPFLARSLSQQARGTRRPIPAVPRDRQSRSSRHGLRRLQFQLLHGAVRGDGRELAGALLRRPIGRAADRRRDARKTST